MRPFADDVYTLSRYHTEVTGLDQTSITMKERKLLTLIREIGFGEVKVFIADGQPVRVEEIKKSVKL